MEIKLGFFYVGSLSVNVGSVTVLIQICVWSDIFWSWFTFVWFIVRYSKFKIWISEIVIKPKVVEK